MFELIPERRRLTSSFLYEKVWTPANAAGIVVTKFVVSEPELAEIRKFSGGTFDPVKDLRKAEKGLVGFMWGSSVWVRSGLDGHVLVEYNSAGPAVLCLTDDLLVASDMCPNPMCVVRAVTSS